MQTRVKQGGVLSQLLFILYRDKYMRENCINVDKEITMAYADDVAITTENEIDLQEAIDRWQDITRTQGLDINVMNAEVMNVSRNREECNIYINEEQLQ